MNPFVCLFFGNPKRLLGTLAGLMVLLAIISPDHFNWVMARAFNALWPWFQIAVFIAIVWAVIASMLPKKGGGKKDG